MKKILILLLSFVLSQGYAQNSQTEAKAAYLLAEESYAKGDYKAALDLLQEVKTSMGSSNCKILYLEIMVNRELSQNVAVGAEKQLALINEFENSPDYGDFSEDKVLEIAKIKLGLKMALKADNDKKEKENAAKAVLDKAFNDILNRLGPWSVSLEKLDSIMPTLNVKEWKRFGETDTYSAPGFTFDTKFAAKTNSNWSIDEGIDYRDKIANVAFHEGKIWRYETFLVFSTAKVDGQKNFDKAINIIKEYVQKIGFVPSMNAVGEYVTYEWKRGGHKITLQLIYKNQNNGSVGPIQLLESLQIL